MKQGVRAAEMKKKEKRGAPISADASLTDGLPWL